MWKPLRTGGLSPLWSESTLNKKFYSIFFKKSSKLLYFLESFQLVAVLPAVLQQGQLAANGAHPL